MKGKNVFAIMELVYNWQQQTLVSASDTEFLQQVTSCLCEEFRELLILQK